MKEIDSRASVKSGIENVCCSYAEEERKPATFDTATGS